MRTSIYIVAVFIHLFILNQVSAQKIPEFGSVVIEELQMKEYEKDKSAEALVLLDMGKSSFVAGNVGYDVLFERRTKIKIFNKAGYDYAEVGIWFYREGSIFEKVYDIVGYTYNLEDGRIVKTPLDISKTYDEKVNEFWNVKKFAMPNVKEGSIVEFKYKIISPYISQLRDWEFQSSIPTVFSQYETRMIPFYEYSYYMQGTSKFDKYEAYESTDLERQFGSIKFKDMIYKFTMKDVPAFKDEEFISSRNDYIMKIDFQLGSYYTLRGAKIDIRTTWPQLSNDFLKGEYGRFINGAEKAAPKVIDFSKTTSQSEVEKIEYIIKSLKDFCAWDNRYGSYPGKSVNEFIKEKNGTATEINLFLVGALRAAGITTNPVLISTRSHGKINTEHPFIHFFNSSVVLAKTEKGLMLLDATDPHCPYNMIPAECLNEKGLIIDKNSEQWVDLAIPIQSSIHKSFNITLNPEMDSLICQMDIRANGYDAVKYRKDIQDKKESVIDNYFKKEFYVTKDSVKFANLSNNLLPYIIKFGGSTKAESISNKIYISPFLKEPITENPFKQSARSYPIDMVYASNKVFNSTFIVPKGYRIESMPKSYSFKNDQIEIELKSFSSEDKVHVVGNYQFKKSVYPSSDYSKMKYYFNEIIKVFNDKIVLVKEETIN